MVYFGSQLVINSLIIVIDQNGELEKRSNDFLLRNFYDKVRDIAETTY